MTEGRMTKSRSSMYTGICTVTLGSGPLCAVFPGRPEYVMELVSALRTEPSRHRAERTMTRQGNSMTTRNRGVVVSSTPNTILQPGRKLSLSDSSRAAYC